MSLGMSKAVLLLSLGIVGLGAAGVAAEAAASTVALPSFGSVSAKGVYNVPLGGSQSQLVTADLNGDGHPDILITVTQGTGTTPRPITILVNDGKGNFSDQTRSLFTNDVPRTENPRQIVVADFNGDGRPDVFIADTGDDRDPYGGFQNTLILSAPGGRLVDATATLPQASDYSHSACVADVNGDGHLDIYVVNIYGSNHVTPRLLLNDGTGHFTVGGSLPPELGDPSYPVRYTTCTFADVNGDGKPDLILGADDHTPNSAVLLNDGAGNFQSLAANAIPAKPFDANAIALNAVPLDVNHDGHIDLLIAFTSGDPFYAYASIQVLINNGDGTFRDETAKRFPKQPSGESPVYFLDLLDLNRDHIPDLGLDFFGAAGQSPYFYTLAANGSYQFRGSLGIPATLWSIADLNGDGRPDLVTVDKLQHTVYVTLQQPSTKAAPKCKRGQHSTKQRLCRR
jgi:hypothetical protein